MEFGAIDVHIILGQVMKIIVQFKVAQQYINININITFNAGHFTLVLINATRQN